jgi:translation initiation factor 3 subunit I
LLFSTSKERDGVAVYYTKTGERLGTYAGGHSAVSSCDVNGASTLLATSGFDLRTCLWDVEKGNLLNVIEHAAPARCVQFNHNDSLLMTVTDNKMGQKGTISLFNLPSTLGVSPVSTKFNPTATFETPECMMYAEWGPNNDTIYFGSDDGSVSILDVATMKEIANTPAHSEEVRRLHFDPNYYTLVTASKDKTAKLLDSRNLKTITTYVTDVPVNDASISPRADHVLIGGGTEAQEVTTTGGQSKFEVKFYHKIFGGDRPMGSLKCHFGTINSVAFHPSGLMFASGAVDGFVKLHTFDDAYENAPGATPVWSAPPAALS